MATLFEYFKVDFTHSIGQTSELESSGGSIKINANVATDTDSSAKFVAYYVPECDSFIGVIYGLIQHTPMLIETSKAILTIASFPGDIDLGIKGSENSVFSNRIYIYSENDISGPDKGALDEYARINHLNITIRGKDYAANKMAIEKPLAFISHDSKDKLDVASEIALGLTRMMCPVWYDEYSLTVGDHLRESIEKGLKETKKCILVLSPNFFSNTGWTKTEFNSVFTREILERSSLVLPVWFNVSVKEVYEYSPSLADRVGLDWNKLGKDEVIRKLYHAVRRVD